MALVEASIEGKIEKNSVGPFGVGGVQLKAMGIPIRFSPGMTSDPYPDPPPAAPKAPRKKTISTPQGEVSVASFLDQTPLPGRSAQGFEEGTVIAEGFFEVQTGLFLADFLTVEPAESVVRSRRRVTIIVHIAYRD